MGNQRRAYTPDYKDDAVKLVSNTGPPIATVSKDLGLVKRTFGNWANW